MKAGWILVVAATTVLAGVAIQCQEAPAAAHPPRRLTAYRDALRECDQLRDLEVYGHRMTCWDQGEGPAVILLHGLGGSLYDWRKLA